MWRFRYLSLVVLVLATLSAFSIAAEGLDGNHQSVEAWGSTHETFGGASIIHLPQLDSLTVVGEKGQNPSGVYILFGDNQVRGFGPVMSFAQSEDQTGVFTATMLGLDETPGSLQGDFAVVGQITVEQRAGIYEVTPDFSSIGTNSYQLQVFRNGVLVHTQDRMTGKAVSSKNLIASSTVRSPKP